MRDLVLLLAADADIQRGYEYYENLQEGRGALFLHHLDASLTYIRSFPEMAIVFEGRYRRMLVPRFPYGIFYTLEANRIVVGGVINLRQDPEAIRRRLTE